MEIVALVLAVVAVVMAISAFLSERRQFKVDDRNPYRRYCTQCGQQQDVNAYDFSFRSPGWWEANGAIIDKNCKCHDYAEYRR